MKLIPIIALIAVGAPMCGHSQSDASSKAEPGEVKVFGDWVVGCNNVLRCEAVGLNPEDQVRGRGREFDDMPYISISITRSPTPGEAPSIEFELKDSINGPVAIAVDDRVTVKAEASHGYISLKGGTALRIAREFARGELLNITQGGTSVVQPSLSGASAALRYMDAQQGRAGGVTALVARGPKPASKIKPPPAMPIVTAAPEFSADEFDMLPDDIRRARKASNCRSKYDDLEDFKDEDADAILQRESVPMYPLDAERWLILLECGLSLVPFTTQSAVLIGSGNPGNLQFSPAVFDFTKNTAADLDDDPDTPQSKGFRTLINADWSPGGLALGSSWRGRANADCGSSRAFLWDGSRFRLTGATEMPECRGSNTEISTWVAETRYAEYAE